MGKGITYSTSGRDCPCCGCQERTVGCHEKSDCQACEKNHVKPESIKECKYHAEQYFANYPDTITVLMEDGKEIKYKR